MLRSSALCVVRKYVFTLYSEYSNALATHVLHVRESVRKHV